MNTAAERNKALLIKHFPQLNDLKLIDEMVEVAMEYDFKEGQIIMDYGENIRMVPLVIKGSIKVMREDDDGNEMFLYYLNGGEACATSFTCCMTNKKSYMKTIAEYDTKVLGLPLKKVDDWISEYRVWKNFVMQAYDSRILEMVSTLDSIAFMRMDERLIKYLQETATALNSNVISNTHQKIANDLNASREAISRLLKLLEKKGMIKLSRNRIELLNISA